MGGSRTLLVDAPSLFYRALFSTPDSVRTPAGQPINAVHGFLNMLAVLIARQRPDLAGCAEDADWRPQWRVDLVPSYKLHRTVPGSPAVQAEERLATQVPVLQDIMARIGLPFTGSAGFEAEDVIGTMAARAIAAGDEVAIFSGDRDLFQLVDDGWVRVLYPRRGTSDLVTVDEAYVAATYGIPGRAYVDFATLRGDPSDGLPGVRGVGEKSAAALVARYGSLEAILAAAEEAGPAAAGPLAKVRRDRAYVEAAAAVVRIRRDVPLPEGNGGIFRLAGLRRRIGERGGLWDLAAAQGLTNAVRRLVDAL